MASFYWVGGAGNWDSVNALNWASTSGGSGGSAGFFPPTSADNVTFDSNSGSGTVTFTNSGVNAASIVTFNSPNILLNLAGNFAIVSAFTLTAGSLSTNGYSFNASALLSTNSNTRSISFGASTITLSAVSPIDFTNSSGLTFNAGTSQINLSYNSTSTATLAGGNLNFYNVTFTGTASNIIVISGSNTFNNLIFSSAASTSTTFSGANTFNNLTITGRTSAGLNLVTFSGNQTITGTFTILASASAVCRTFLRSDIVEVTRTLTCNAFATAINVDFRDITIAGSAAPISGTRFGNAKGNSGINFPAAKTVYFRATGNASWGASTSWSATSGGTVDGNQFPLAQDTAIFPATTYPSAGATVTLNANYAIGTIDMSLRTTNAIVFAFGTFAFSVYGDFISSSSSFSSYTGTAGGAALSFYGRTTQNITSAGRVLPRSIVISGGGTVKLLDALLTTDTTLSSIISGTLDLNGYTATIGSSISITGTSPRGIIFAGATLTVGSSSTGTGTVWDATDITNLTLDGTGTLNVNNGSTASPKTFIGGGYQNYPNISFSSNLLFAGATVTGSNKFGDHTSSGGLSSSTGLKFTGGTVNEFSSFNLSGGSGVYIPLKSTNTTQATLRKPTAWVMGPSSTNVIGNTGLTFSGGTAGVNDYLQVSYINGVAGGASYAASITEDAAVGDLSSTLYAYLASLYEDFSPADTSTNLVGFLSNQTENVTSDDSSTQLAALYQSQNENVQSDDSSTQQAAYLSSITEDFSPADAATITVQIYVNQTENFSPADLSLLSFQFFVSQTEDTGVLDTSVSTAQLSVSQTEDFSPADVTSIGLRILISQTENITSADAATAVVQFVISQAEGFTPADAYSIASAFFQSISENVSAADLATSVRNLFFALNENVASANSQTISLQFLQLVQENLNLQEFSGVPVAFNVSLVENVNMLDGPFVSGGWIKVDDTQSITWQNVSTPQTPTWTAVNDSQTPGWTPIVT